ncbi:MAG: hypothetical protein ACF8NJ_07860 [Phycisphaerales bacterium JB038]
MFDLAAMPEPYLDFEAGDRPLVVLTTNPGGPMAHQLRSAYQAGRGPVKLGMTYREAARALAIHYIDVLVGTAAGRRIEALRDLAAEGGFDGVLQVECIPWHSRDLPNKSRLLGLISREQWLRKYLAQLKDLVRSAPAMAVSAVSSRIDLEDPTAPLSPWLSWQLSVLGIERAAARIVPLVRKGSRVTGVALVQRVEGANKALVLMMGSNNLPGSEGRAILEDVFVSA